MVCSSCGVRNVEFASICFSCRKPIGSPPAAPASVSVSEAASTPVSRETTRGSRPASPTNLVRFILVVAVAWAVSRGGFAIRDALFALFATGSTEPGQQSPDMVAPDTAVDAAPDEPHAAAVEEQNGVRLVHFEWSEPTGGPQSRFHVGETVRGRSEIQGFGVTADGRIDVTVALAFRDSTGALVEPVSPTVLRQPVESETLFTSFYYAIAADAPAGDYELEIAVDDAVSARSARFHRTIAVEASAADSSVEVEAE